MTHALISLSGGLDSAVLLAMLVKNKKEGDSITAVNFHYAARHNRSEHRAFGRLSAYYKVSNQYFDVRWFLDSERRSALSSGSPHQIPEGHYEEESMRQTVIPGRNLLFASVMAATAEASGAREIYMGVHAGDHHIYPDCRPSFVAALGITIKLSTDGKVELYCPFINMKKHEIVKLGLAMGVPFHMTWTCYNGGEVACGKCGSCQERLEAFKLNDVEDPIDYYTRELMPKN